ncbi:hypothetical protein T484DRAFT_1898510 [Baffinella frigidus]|nr:hypothetical protein T484DRAFT_1898510 [Cryptophyta sp. CCMP2293]
MAAQPKAVTSDSWLRLAAAEDKQVEAWVRSQRKVLSSRVKLSPVLAERRRRLAQMGFVFDNNERKWFDSFGQLVLLRQQHGAALHTPNVPLPLSEAASRKAPEGRPAVREETLVRWIRRQREASRTGELSAEKRMLLLSLGVEVRGCRSTFWSTARAFEERRAPPETALPALRSTSSGGCQRSAPGCLAGRPPSGK